MSSELRREALRAALGHGLFDAVVLGQSFWRVDPTDASTVHVPARQKFDQLLASAKSGHSRTLLLIGETGAGKSHLLRAMRATAAERGAICAYAQFNAQEGDYLRHFLKRLVDSLGEPFHSNGGNSTGLTRFFDLCRARDPNAIRRLEKCWQDDDESDDAKRRAVGVAADAILPALALGPEDLSVVKALLYSNAPSFAVQARARQFLAGDPLSEFDREHVPDLPIHSERALRQPLLVSLARVLSAGDEPLVYFFDQAEALWSQEPTAVQRAFEIIMDFIDASKKVATVIAWEKARYEVDFFALPEFLRHRFANGLTSALVRNRTEAEIREIIGRRLKYAVESANAELDPANPLFPLPETWPVEHARSPTRTVLLAARTRAEQELGEHAVTTAPPDEIETIDSRWKAALDSSPPGPEKDHDVLDLLAWACTNAHIGNVAAQRSTVTEVAGLAYVDLEITAGVDVAPTRLFALSGKLQGGGMLGRVNAAIARKQGRRAVAVRLDAFPENPATRTAQQLIDLLSMPKGLCVRPTPEELRRLAAYRDFVAVERGKPGFADWAAQAAVLHAIVSVRLVLDLPPDSQANPKSVHAIDPSEKRTHEPNPPPARAPAQQHTPLARAHGEEALVLGLSANGECVALDPTVCTKHVAVLGGSGSGKTTLILSIVEQLMMLNIPSVLVDRKGDFAAYADDASWTASLADGLTDKRQQLRDRLDVAVFTPAKTAGRPLALGLLPADIGELNEDDRREATRTAAEALGDMIGLNNSEAATQRREVLAQTIEYAAKEIGAGLCLKNLVSILHEGAPALQDLLRILDGQSKHRLALAPMLERLRMARGALFALDGERLDFASLIESSSGKTRMAIISLAFLPEVRDQQFYVSRLFAEARRYCRQHPSSRLQCVLVLDEADLYMPVQAKPATKEPLLDLLRRARSGGMGIILGTQSPADLDYKGRDNIATWALGRIQSKTAIDKVTFAAEGTEFEPHARLPTLATGQFFIRTDGFRGEVKTHRNLVETRQLSEEQIIQAARRGSS